MAVAATFAAVVLGIVARSTPVTTSARASETIDAAALGSVATLRREAPVSRAANRQEHALLRDQKVAYTRQMAHAEKQETLRVVRHAKKRQTKLWTTTVLDIWSAPGADAKQLGELPESKLVLITGREQDGRVELVLKGVSRWVTSGYLAEDKPVTAPAGTSSAPCANTSVEHGLTSNAVLVYRSVCHAFPQITSYGGWDAHGEHASGRALDIMTSDVALGTAIAEYLRAHASELHLYDVIWRQHIWTPERSSEGWRLMPSRGSTTANHYDHVHVSTY